MSDTDTRDDEDEDAPWPALSGGGCTWGEIENLAAEMAAGRDVPTKRPASRAKRTAKARRSARKGPLGRGR